MTRLALVALAALALAGCKGGGNTVGKQDAVAEVLPGSISDAMISYDTLRSQPPLAVPSPQAGRVTGEPAKADEAVADASEAADDPKPSSTPAAPVTPASSAP